MRDQVFTILQAIGRSFMLPVAILPIAGLLLGIGASFTNATTIQTYGLENILGNGTILHSLLTIMSDAGNIIFGNLPIIFAVGVAIGMAKQEKEVAALSAMIAFLVMHASTSSVLKLTGKVLADNTVSPDVLEGTIANINGIMSLQEGVFGGIIVGIGVAYLHNRFHKIVLPDALSFFGGSRFVPIISTVVYMFVGIAMYFIWPVVQNGIFALGGLVTGTGYIGTLIFGIIKHTETKLYTKADVKARDAAGKGGADGKASSDTISQTITQALGGSQNITSVDACATRLRCSVADASLVNDAALKATGAVGVIKRGTGVQVVYGPQVAVIKSNLENYLATNPQDGPIEAVPEAAPAEEPKKEAAAPAKTDAEKRYFNSPFTGALHPITEAPDEAFASKMTGDGFFVYPKDGVVYAPEDSTVTFVFETKHAIGMTTADGVEYLLHIGIDTVNLNGQGFKVFVENGQEVKKGDKLMEFDDEYIKANAPSDACLCIFTDTDQVSDVSLVKTGNVKAGEQAVYF